MSSLRYRDEESSASGLLFLAAGAVAGLAAGVFVAQKFGGFGGLANRLRARLAQDGDDTEEMETDEYDDESEGDEYDEEYAMADETLEERVLEAFRNDPILSERAVDIGAVGEGIIELTGWVHASDESEHAVTLTRGVPGVETVVNRIAVREDEQLLDETAERFESGDDSLTAARWEGQQVGTGRRRQGTSAEPDRHADPKPNLEDRWMSEEQALRAAAEETEGIAERRKGAKKTQKGDRTGGAPVAPTGVPKGDHVADPVAAEDVLREQTGRDTRRAD